MRYILQIIVMLSDIAIITAVCVIIYSMPQLGSLGMLICIYVIAKAYEAWKHTGGFIAWKPSEVKKYMKNAKELGL
jgi:uncharacterized protein (DUF779 family)